MTAVAARPDVVDARDPVLRLSKLFDDGTLELLWPRDDSGVVAGRGRIDGNPAVSFCTDATVMGGAMGSAGCRLIVDTIDLAVRERVPVVGVWHSGGARLAEGVEALHAVGLPQQLWLSDPNEALYVIVIMTVWGWVGFGALAGFAALDKLSLGLGITALAVIALVLGSLGRVVYLLATVP